MDGALRRVLSSFYDREAPKAADVADALGAGFRRVVRVGLIAGGLAALPAIFLVWQNRLIGAQIDLQAEQGYNARKAQLLNILYKTKREGLWPWESADEVPEAPRIARGSAAVAFVKLERQQGAEPFLPHVNLRKTALNDVDFSGVVLEGADFRESSLYEADLRGAHLFLANLDGARLEGSKLVGANLCHASLRETRLDSADLSDAEMEWVDLDGAHLKGAILRGAMLKNAGLCYTGSIEEGPEPIYSGNRPPKTWYPRGISPANLVGADLQGENLYDADLWYADFSGANLSGVDLRQADLKHANLVAAHLSEAKLGGAVLRGVRWDDMTIWPDPPPVFVAVKGEGYVPPKEED